MHADYACWSGVIRSQHFASIRETAGTKITFVRFEIHTMMVSGRTWIVVLDDLRARFFKREVSGALTKAAPDVTGGSAAGHSPTPQSRRTKRDRILQEALAVTDAACVRNECERLVVIAPDRMLSAFRKQAPPKVRARLWRERAGEAGTMSANDIAHSVEPYFREGSG